MATFAEKRDELIEILNAGKFEDVFVKDMTECGRFVFPKRYAGKNFKAIVIVVPNTEPIQSKKKIIDPYADPLSDSFIPGRQEIPLPPPSSKRT